MKEDWAEQLRRKLEGHELPPPDGLWESICEQMDKPFGLKPLFRLTGTAQRWWAAAAVVLAIVGCFVLYEMSDNDQPLQAEAVSQQQTTLQPSSEPVVAQPPSSHRSQNIPLASGLSPLTSDQEKQKTTVVEQHEEPVEQHEEPLEEHEEPIEQEQQPAQKVTAKKELPVPTEIHDLPTAPVVQKKWSVALRASGGLLAANNSMQTDRLYKTMTAFDGSYDFREDGSTYSSASYTITEYAAKHHLPLRLGLSLQYQLHPRLALLSGISYTRLSSEFSFPLYRNISYSQKLHYIGIPFSVVWQLWRAKRLSFYLSGGVMVEKCVSVDLGGDYQGKKPWQFSVNGAAGAEFAFTSLLGAYIEPSLGYYFSDGTQLEHYYKEHPLAPSIEFGLRFHVGK